MSNRNSQENGINWQTPGGEEKEQGSNDPIATLKNPTIENTGSRELGQPYIIGFTGTKGGVGTTTVALNVAMTFVQLGQKVIYVEMSHHFGSVAWQLGMPQPAPVNFGSLNPKEVDANFIAKVLMTHSTGLQICCLSPWVDDDGHHISAEILKTLLRELATQAHTIILDFPLERSNSTALFLQLSQLLNVVMDVDPMNIAAAKMQLKFVHRQSHAPVFLTGVNRINIPPAESLRQIQDEMECATFTMIPSASELCYTANIQHLPLVCIKPSSIPGLQFVKLRDQILSHLNGDDTENSRDRRGKHRRKKDRRHSSDGW